MSRLDALSRDMEEAECVAVQRIHRRYAGLYLAELRAMLAGFNLSRHNVTISSGMGSACLCVNGAVWPGDGRLDHRMDSVVCELRAISANLSHKWADYVNGESLTHYPGSQNEARYAREQVRQMREWQASGSQSNA